MADIKIPDIVSVDTMDDVIQIFGMIPLLRTNIYGWSIQDHCRSMWSEEGPWEWKGPVLRNGNCAYGDFFGNRACFVSKQLLPDFINSRKDLHMTFNEDLQALDDIVLQELNCHDEITSSLLAKTLGFLGSKQKLKDQDFADPNNSVQHPIKIDSILKRLMRQGKVCISDFTYKLNKQGQPYGWGIALYTTMEKMFGKIEPVERTPLQSAVQIVNHLENVLPWCRSQFRHPMFIKRIQGGV